MTPKTYKLQGGITLSDEQIDAINNVVKSSVSVITGGPGSGKTTMVQGLVSTLKTLKAKSKTLCTHRSEPLKE